MLNNFLLKSIRDYRFVVFFWAIGITALNALIIGLYPQLTQMPELEAFIKSLPKELNEAFGGDILSFTTPLGYINSGLFALRAPLLLTIFAVTVGTSLAKEEERGYLELLLAHPIDRLSLVIQKFISLLILTIFITFIFWLTMSIGIFVVGMDVSVFWLLDATISLYLLAMAFGSLGILFGSIFGKRGPALALTLTILVSAYLISSLAALSESLKTFEKLSPFYYYNSANPIHFGLNPYHALVLTGITIFSIILAAVIFERRDLKS